MKFDQNYKIKIKKITLSNKETEIKDETGQLIPQIITTIKTETAREINLNGIIQENKPLTIKQMIIKFSTEQIAELGKEGTYLNNIEPIDLQKLAQAQAEYKKTLKEIQLKKQKETKQTQENKPNQNTEGENK